MPQSAGPPYPHPNPAPGSNQIGQFQVGVSPIGTISAFDVWSTIISQYANSGTLTGIITSMNSALDQTENFDELFDDIWNVFTATGYGLDCWGRIVGASRTYPVSVVGPVPTFGFQEPGSDWVGFGQAPFVSGTGVATNNVTLTDTQYRPVVLAKAMSNIWNGSIPGFNAILLALFAGRGTPYVQDNGNMSITLVFAFPLLAIDLAILNSNILPQPAGVVINVSYP
jgi:hypothetical protein